MPVWLTILLTVISVVFPTGTFLVLAVRHGKTLQKVDGLQEDVTEIKAAIPMCQKERRANENELHGRITVIATAQAANVERSRGLNERVSRVEKKVLNGSAAS